MREYMILVGLGVRAAERHRDLVRLARDHATPAGVGYLQLADPALVVALDAANDRGARRIVLVAVDVHGCAPELSWVRRVAAHWCRGRGDERPGVEMAPRTLTALDAEELARVLSLNRRPVTGDEAPLACPPWEEVPRHRHQLLICRGPRCSAQGADRTTEVLTRRLHDRSIHDDQVLVTMTGCQYPCNHAPVVTVQPDDVWYGGVTEEVAERLVDGHLQTGVPLDDHRLARPTPTEEC